MMVYRKKQRGQVAVPKCNQEVIGSVKWCRYDWREHYNSDILRIHEEPKEITPQGKAI